MSIFPCAYSVLLLFLPLQVSAVRKTMLCCNLLDHFPFPSSFSPLGATLLTRKAIPTLSPTNTHVMTCNRLGSRYGLALSGSPAELNRQIFCNGVHRRHKHCMWNQWMGPNSLSQSIRAGSMKRSALLAPETDLHPSTLPEFCVSGSIGWVASISSVRGVSGTARALTQCLGFLKQKYITGKRDVNAVLRFS